MKIPHDKFCVLPWVSLEASPIGTVRPCCLARREIRNDSGEKFHLARHSFESIQHSNHMRDLRRVFLKGEKPADCDRCWSEESAGRVSKRMHTLDRLKHMIDDAEWTEHARPLIFLDLKLGNICNLKCRICGSWSSSTIASEEIMAVTNPQERKQTFAYTMLRAGSWPRESSKFWIDLDQHLDEIRYIEFTGGEPFMIEEHFDLLQGLIDRGIADQIEIHYNTNGSIWPDRGSNIWRHFRHVEVAFSIDDKDRRFNYQRSGADWDKVLLNINRFRKLRAQINNISLQVCCTISVFNILYIGQLWDLFCDMEMDYIYWNILHDPPHLSIAHAPEEVKTAARKKLALWMDQSVAEEFRKVMTFMDQGDSWNGDQLREDILKLDVRREERLIEVLPELNRALGMMYPSLDITKKKLK